MIVDQITAAELVRRYQAQLTESERTAQQAELARFLRWLGGDAPIGRLRASDVESYQEQAEAAGAGQARLEPVRNLFRFAHQEKLTEINLSKFIKFKRPTVKKQAVKAQSHASSGDDTAQLTVEGHTRLREELDHLVNVTRAEIANDLYEARIDKDIRENAPFDAAKQHQAEVEARIRNLEHILGNAEIIEQPTNAAKVSLGSTVVLYDVTHDEEVSFILVGTNEANPRLGRVSAISPVGKAMVDRTTGEEFEVSAPGGLVRYRIQRIQNEA